MPRFTTADIPDMSGKVVLVTGGNGGIGYVTCKELLIKGAKVYIAARQSQKSENAIARLQKETGKEAYLIPINLSELRTVRVAAEVFLSKESRLDVLINNAGVMASPISELTNDGYDLQFGVNVLAHFHFTTLLLPALLQADSQARVINVSSAAHRFATNGIDFASLKGPKQGSRFGPIAFVERYKVYGQSKLGNILFNKELHRRYQAKLYTIALHPGVIKTDLTRNHSGILQKLTGMASQTPENGALTTLYAASSADAIRHDGKYLVPYGREEQPSRPGCDSALAERMWEWCENELKGY